MVLDSSAVIAIIQREPGFEELEQKIRSTRAVGMGAPTLVETGLVLESRFGAQGRALLDLFLRDYQVIPLAFGDFQWKVAVTAFVRFGKGRHPAALNFGDCLTYATARLADQPLLCTGDDFPATDLEIA